MLMFGLEVVCVGVVLFGGMVEVVFGVAFGLSFGWLVLQFFWSLSNCSFFVT